LNKEEMKSIESNSEEILKETKNTISLFNGTLSIRKLKPSKRKMMPLDKLAPEDMIPITFNSMFKAMIYNSNRTKYPIHILKYFLEENIDKLLLTKTEVDLNTYENKEMRVDFVACVKDMCINIEMNRKNTLGRNANYLSRLCSKKVKRGKSYDYLKGLQINLNDFEPPHNKTMDIYKTVNSEDDVLIPQIFVNIYLPNLRKLYYNEGKEKLTRFERSILVMIATKKSEALELAKGDKVMTDYVKEANDAMFLDDDLREAYDHEAESLLAEREIGFDEGHEQGTKDKSIAIAKEMKKRGYSLEVISDILKEPINKLSSWLL